jgi:hypothetical protein
MKIEAERGYLVVAQNNSSTDYIKCARMLAYSIKAVEPAANICLLTDQLIEDSAFDFVRVFPFGDQSVDLEWKLKNDWQCFYASPFRETIKLEADMIVPQSIKHWFDICSSQEIVVTVGARNFHNRLSTSRAYRKIFDQNNLPDVYNAVTYWRLSRKANEFFEIVKHIFNNWAAVMSELKFGANQPLNTDLAYAIAVHILGEENCTLPGSVPSMIHMKGQFNELSSEDWTKELVWELNPGSLRINTIEQFWPFHYHIKEFANHLEKYYGCN